MIRLTVGHIFSDSRFRQRAISGPCGYGGFSTAPGSLGKAALLDLRWPRQEALQDPVWFPLFVKGGDTFARFGRFPGLDMIFQRKVDVFLY